MSINKYGIYCITEQKTVYTWDFTAPTQCPNNGGHSVNINSVSLIANSFYKQLTSADISANISPEFTIADTSTGNVFIYLPDATKGSFGTFRIKKTSALNTLTVQPILSQLIDASSNITATANNSLIILKSNGTNWITRTLETDTDDTDTSIYDFIINKEILKYLYGVKENINLGQTKLINGEIYLPNGAIILLSVDTTATIIAPASNTLSAGSLNGFTYRNSIAGTVSAALITQYSGKYAINCSLSFSRTNNPTRTLDIAIYVNSIKKNNIVAQQQTVNGVTYAINMSGIIDLVLGDTIDVRLIGIGGIASITITTLNLNIVQVSQ